MASRWTLLHRVSTHEEPQRNCIRTRVYCIFFFWENPKLKKIGFIVNQAQITLSIEKKDPVKTKLASGEHLALLLVKMDKSISF